MRNSEDEESHAHNEQTKTTKYWFFTRASKETDERSNNHRGYFITAQDHSYLEAVHLETKIKKA